MVTWIPSIYPLYVSIYTSTMDPSWAICVFRSVGCFMEYPVQQKRGLNQETITIALLQVGELNLSRNMDGGTFNKK